MKKINLSAALSSAINLPRYKDTSGDFPLYPHTDDSKIQMKRSDNWHKYAKTTFNSPSNVRVVCLSRDGANVLYWASPIKSGKTVQQKELASDYVLDITSKAGIKQSINPFTYRWDSAGLQCLINPVIMSNIEELWIAVELLACPMYDKHFKMLLGVKPGQVVLAEFLYALLEREISTSSKPRNIKETFPLLRSIVVVNSPVNSNVSDFHKYAIRTERIKAELESETPNKRRVIGESPLVIKKIAEESGFGFAVCPITTGDITKFSLGDYKFDEKYLVSYKEAILKKYSQDKSASLKHAAQSSVLSTNTAEDLAKKIYNDVIERLSLANYKKINNLVNMNTESFIFKIETGDKRIIEVKFNPINGLYRIASDGLSVNNCVPQKYLDTLKYAEHLAVKISEFAFPPVTGSGSVAAGDKEILFDIIKSMEVEFSDTTIIKQALYAYKKANPSFFKEQIPLLPQDVRDKYAAVFQ